MGLRTAAEVGPFWYVDEPRSAFSGNSLEEVLRGFPAQDDIIFCGKRVDLTLSDITDVGAFIPSNGPRDPAIGDFAGPIPLPALQSMFDGLYPPGLQWYWNADFFTELSDEMSDLHMQHGSQLPTVRSTIHLYPINGAAHRVGETETTWSYREANFAEVIMGVDPDPANNERMIRWAKACWEALHPHSARGAYVNMMMDEGQERVRAAYRDNYPRLARIKAKHDPHNLFQVNQNIRPAG